MCNKIKKKLIFYLNKKTKKEKELIMDTILVILFYYTFCVRPFLWIIDINPYIFYYEVLKIEKKDEYIIHRYWWNILSEFLFFLIFPMEVKYVSF